MKMNEKNTLLILAFNEESNLEIVINQFINDFEYLLIVDDASTDNTKNIIENLKHVNSNLHIVRNEKNLGAGYSFQTGINYIKNNLKDTKIITKIDGDGQFEKKDIIKIRDILNSTNVDFVKSNRFWENGIEGNIPTIRFFGNSLASLLIKFITGQFKINDPLNGLFGFRYENINYIDVPKIFKRYGYPFYISSLFVGKNLLISEIHNLVKYNIGEKSQLKAIPLFFKLVIYSIKFFFSNIVKKLRQSQLQMSAILDMFFIFLQFNSFLIIFKFITIRYFDVEGSQTNWLILFVMIQLSSLVVICSSKVKENNFRSKFFVDQDL